jgi:hypothetical protein
MKIFNAEIRDGLSEKIKSGNSLALLCPVEACVAAPSQENIEQLRIVSDKMDDSEQIDLYYLNSILVSTGWNKNDDVFLAEAAWDARNTPEDKQFNFMHDESDIIGHITGSHVIDGDGNRTEGEVPPDQFDIIRPRK